MLLIGGKSSSVHLPAGNAIQPNYLSPRATIGRSHFKNDSRPGSALPQFVLCLRHGELLRRAREASSMNEDGTGSRSSLGGMGEVPQRDSPDMEFLRSA